MSETTEAIYTIVPYMHMLGMVLWAAVGVLALHIIWTGYCAWRGT